MGTRRAVVIAEDALGSLEGKTANCLVMYGRDLTAVAVIDGSKTGRDEGEVLGIGPRGIPVVGSL
ncbi:MAG: DUF1611 domain-containing protein, partial [Candidatus Bathyarchaeia archaeon]